MIAIPYLPNRWSPWLGRAQPLSSWHWDLVRRIRAETERVRRNCDQELRNATDGLRDHTPLPPGPFSDATLAAGFSLVYEAVRRTLGIKLYDEQLVAGLVLAGGGIAEMQTGEGKTLAAAAPAVLHALRGGGVHVITVNRYLADRDFHQLRPAYELLGISVGKVDGQTDAHSKRQAYRCDITYAPGYEVGFDFLRDQVALYHQPRLALGQTFRHALRGQQPTPQPPLQRGLPFAIIDEIDSVLIDEARLPLVLSQPPDQRDAIPDPSVYRHAQQLAVRLVAGRDYLFDEATRDVRLTEPGHATVEKAWSQLARPPVQRPWSVYVQQALQAELTLRKNVDYVVVDDQIRIVDESTGRIFADRSWQDGLHQAVEVKEGVAVTSEHRSVAKISRQRLFHRYDGLCGMTGTARGSQQEFWDLYRLPVVPIPLRVPCRRVVAPTRFFADQDAKWKAMLKELANVRPSGRPIMIGTRSIANSERLSELLRRRGIEHRLLTGLQDESEAEVIARAGELGAITIATNMAGRGTDIQLSQEAVQHRGLHIMGDECNDSDRIDRQLMGRAARQGDPGSCQFFVSADDSLIRTHDCELQTELQRRSDQQGEAHLDYSRRIARTQRKVARQNRAARKEMLRQDRWLEELADLMTNTDDAGAG